ncbi:MAG: hypothetical protein IKH98_05445 [Candidatus Methanomethylophilaceae archaeon]|nr:hypothetical protein [Candidatus Methanomethylophilaceae archaeon]
MTTGRRRRVMVACVTFETSKIVDPVDFYEANEVHLIHYSKNPDDADNVYNAFYNRVVEMILAIPRNIEIVEHNEVVYDFGVMLRTVLEILQSDDGDREVYVNVSAGTSEYTAASTIASMMVPGTVPFSVNTREFTVAGDRIKDLYYVDGKPVGLTKVAGEPKTLPSYSIDIPEEHLVRGLRILDDRNARKLSISSPNMVTALKEAGIWYRDTEGREDMKTSQRQTEAVYYQRDFVSKWQKSGWIRKHEMTGKYVLTEQGRIVIETFYTV